MNMWVKRSIEFENYKSEASLLTTLHFYNFQIFYVFRL
ncbi:Uncharacterised protein [Mycoplasmopsis caviae]|uniref:Uncharacterized protein n=1 Tax=Mycoplasmopsis caviae TaxID=55603 RepID=A0A3P8KW57_9BACT|nr:Uncharacterised protein [Mycoplasmopsis caviae]